MVSIDDIRGVYVAEYLWIVIGVLGATVFYYNYIRPWRFFAKYRVKYDLGIPPFGSHYREFFGCEPWRETLRRIYYQHPNERFVGMHEIGGRPEYLIRDPELVKQITIRDFNYFVNRIHLLNAKTDPILGHELTNLKANDWRRVRNILTPLFTGQKMKQIVVPSLNTTKTSLIAHLNEQITASNTNELVVDMMDLSTRSGVDSFCLTAFGLQTDSLSGDDYYGYYNATRSFLKDMNKLSEAQYWAIMKFPWIMKLIFGKSTMSDDLNKFFEQSYKDIADNRILNRINRNDYLRLLQVLRDNNPIGDGDNDNAKDCTESEVIAQCFEFYESVITENNLLTSFVAQQLANNQDIQNRLFDELTEIHNNLNGEALSYESFTQMKYLDMIISESLRMCPIATELKRRATKPYVLENSNGEKVTIKPGEAVWIPAFTLQNDPKYYKNPEIFDPERFNEENRKSHISGTYAPYGMGPRDCIGCRYATMEVKAAIYYLLLEFAIAKADDNKKEFSVRLVKRATSSKN